MHCDDIVWRSNVGNTLCWSAAVGCMRSFNVVVVLLTRITITTVKRYPSTPNSLSLGYGYSQKDQHNRITYLSSHNFITDGICRVCA